MQRWVSWVLSLGLVMGAASAQAGAPQPKRDFSADLVMKMDGGPMGAMESKGRVYFSGGKQRREMEVMGRKTISIERPDKGVQWTLIPAQKLVLESKIGESEDAPPNPMAEGSFKKIGTETVNGVEADKYEITADGTTGTGWMTSDHVPVRYEGTSTDNGQTVRVRMDYTNHQFATPKAELFEYPAGYSQAPTLGLGGLGAPGAGGAPPSNAEMQKRMEELRKQAEQMRKQYGN